jgi:hypothetical protein
VAQRAGTSVGRVEGLDHATIVAAARGSGRALAVHV